jgi:hypothetical protein
MDFSLSEDQQAFVSSARAFAEGVLAPNAATWDEKSIFPKDALRQAGDLGFMGMYTPGEGRWPGHAPTRCKPDRRGTGQGLYCNGGVSDYPQYGYQYGGQVLF